MPQTEFRKVWQNGGCSATTIPAKFGFRVGEYVKLTLIQPGKVLIEKVEG